MTKHVTPWVNGLIGVLIFAGSLPATRIAVSGFTPEFLTVIRAVIAAIFAVFVLVYFKEKPPVLKQLYPLSIVILGVIIGFPLFTALALQYISASQSIMFVGLLPLCTACFAVLLGEGKPKALFWVFAILGSGIVIGFTSTLSHEQSYLVGNLYMILAISLCGLGYAAGGKLSREIGGWQVISWALVISLPVTLPLSFYFYPSGIVYVDLSILLSVLYVSAFSMFIGFIFWYKALAQGGVLAIGQLQLLQPFFGFLLAALILKETISLNMLYSMLITGGCVWCARKYM